MPVRLGQTLRFGPFSLDPRCGELRTNGTRIKLQGQPIQVLELLLEKPGELVSREEIRQKLWSSDTFVDFDHNLNTAIKKLRQALGDEADTPKYIETLPRYGYRFIGEVAQEEERKPAAASQSPTERAATQKPEHRAKYRPMILISVGLVAALLICLLVIYRWRHQPSSGSRTPVRAKLELHGSSTDGTALSLYGSKAYGAALSRDGNYLSYFSGPTGQIWVKDLQKGGDEPLPGTESALSATWSPDGRYIAFVSDYPHKLKKIALDSKIITEICDLAPTGSLSWGTSDLILVGGGEAGVKAVSVTTGGMQLLSTEKAEWFDSSPVFLPDGNHYLFVRFDKSRYATRGASGVLYVGTVDGRPPSSLDIRVIGYVRYAAGRLLYNTHQGLFSQPFDLSRLRILDNPILLIPSTGNGIYFSVSENGILASRPYAASVYEGESELRLFARNGKPVDEPFAQGYPDQARFSPDGKRIAYDQIIGDYRDIWIYDLERRVNTRLTPGDSMYSGPVWSPDGKRIAYQYRHKHVRGIAMRNSDGSGQPEVLFENTYEDPLYYWPRSWSPGGDYLFITVAGNNGPRKIGVLYLDGDRKAKLLPATTNTSRTYPIISPEGNWLAYQSNEAGGNKSFVQPYPGTGENILVSGGNGSHPQWRRDGRELFFLSGSNMIEAVSISYQGNEIKIGKPAQLFRYTPSMSWGNTFDPSPDGQLFVVNAQRVLVVPSNTYDVITNFDLLANK